MFFSLSFATVAAALDLSGLLLYAADPRGNRAGSVWHTSSGLRAAPLSFNAWNPGTARSMHLPNDARGEIDQALAPGTHVLMLYFQPDDGPFPPHLVLNLYFDGDKTRPGISVLVPHRRGFTHAGLNPAHQTLSLYLEEVDNDADLFYSDGALQVRAGAAFYFPSSGLDTQAWLPGDLYQVDRVGPRELEPDGEWDGILVVELDVGPAPRRRPTLPRPPIAAGKGLLAPPILVERAPPASTPTSPPLEWPTPRTTSTAGRWQTPPPSGTRTRTPTPRPATPTVAASPSAT